MICCLIEKSPEPPIVIALVKMDNHFYGAVGRFGSVITLVQQLCQFGPVAGAAIRPEHSHGDLITNLDPLRDHPAPLQCVEHFECMVVNICEQLVERMGCPFSRLVLFPGVGP